MHKCRRCTRNRDAAVPQRSRQSHAMQAVCRRPYTHNMGELDGRSYFTVLKTLTETDNTRTVQDNAMLQLLQDLNQHNTQGKCLSHTLTPDTERRHDHIIPEQNRTNY